MTRAVCIRCGVTPSTRLRVGLRRSPTERHRLSGVHYHGLPERISSSRTRKGMASKSVGPLWFALWAFLVPAACRGASNADREVLRYAIPVGSTPVALAAALDGHIVVSVNISGTLSVIDVHSHREVARLDVPLKASHDRLVDVAVDSRGTHAWAISNGGEIFSADLESRRVRLRFRSPEALPLSAVAWDEERKRVLVGDRNGGIHALHGETLDPIFSSADQAIMDIRVRRSVLYFLSAGGPDVGEGISGFGAVDLAADRLVFEHVLEGMFVTTLSVAGNRVWVAEMEKDRLLEFTVHGRLVATRNLSSIAFGPDGRVLGENGGRRLPEFQVDLVAASRERVIVASGETSARLVLEYPATAGDFPTLPVAQYEIPDSCIALCLLGKWGFAVALTKNVMLIGHSEARPVPSGTGSK